MLSAVSFSCHNTPPRSLSEIKEKKLRYLCDVYTLTQNFFSGICGGDGLFVCWGFFTSRSFLKIMYNHMRWCSRTKMKISQAIQAIC